MNASPNVHVIEWSTALESEPRVDVQREVRDLTSAIAAGDTVAFTRFFDEWFDSMYAEAVRVTGGDESFCLDVVQDAMLRVVRSLKPMDTPDDLRRWLRVVVQCCAYDRFRAETRRRAREQKVAADPPRPADRTADTRARLQWLENELRSLDARSSDLLLMRHRFGWTLRQIGDALGLKPGAVDSRLRRLVAALRRKGMEKFDD